MRHKPEEAGLTLDRGGWVEVDTLLQGLRSAGRPLSREQLVYLVLKSDKQRYAFSADGRRIRANQGHSIPVDLELRAAVPPSTLYHGTVERFMASIETQGLTPQKRHHVHLSPDRQTALKVGSRRGTPVLLGIEAGRMHAAGHEFFVSENGVWLVAAVPPEYLGRLHS